MSFMVPRQAAAPTRPQSLYFAYGSNLQLKQMAKRCPDSQFLGRARLHAFRWQINDRGFANIVPDPDSFVEGLCYLLSVEDEVRLDRSEGVPTAYQKKWTEVEFFPAAANVVGRKVTEILRWGLLDRESEGPPEGSRAQSQETRSDSAGSLLPRRDVTEITYFRHEGRTHVIKESGTRPRGHSVPPIRRHEIEARPQASQMGRLQGEPVKVLVYLSENHTKDGLPWDEYVDRMNWGVIDGKDLGISPQYVEKYITPYLKAATGLNGNGETKGRGVREKKKRKHLMSKKPRRSEEIVVGPEEYGEQGIMQVEPMNWETTQDAFDAYHEYHGS